MACNMRQMPDYRVYNLELLYFAKYRLVYISFIILYYINLLSNTRSILAYNGIRLACI